MLFRQRERVLVFIVASESDDLACMMLNINMDIECVHLHLTDSRQKAMLVERQKKECCHRKQ